MSKGRTGCQVAPMHRWLVLLSLVALSLLQGTPVRSRAQESSGWSTPVNLSESTTQSYYPDIAVDSAGHLYVVWGEFSADQAPHGWPEFLMFRMWDGETWSEPNDVALSGHLPQIGVDSRGRLHLLKVGGPYSRTWAQNNPSDARSWTPGRDWALRSPYWPDMVVDNRDRIHIVFQDTWEYNEERIIDNNGLCITGCRGIFYTRSMDGGDSWSAPFQLDTPSGDVKTPRLAVDDLGNVYVVWVDTDAYESPLGISFGVSTDGGETWSPLLRIVSGSEEGYDCPQVAVDSMGTIHVVWRRWDTPIGGLEYVTSSDGGESWSQPEQIDVQPHGAYSFGLAVDSADNLHLVIPLKGGGLPMGVYHLVHPRGGSWSSAAPISQNTCSTGSADVELAIGQGNHLHAVWYDRPECKLGFIGPSGRGEVFYSDFFSDAASIAPWPLPPMPTTTPQPSPTPSPTPALVDPTREPTAMVPPTVTDWGPDPAGGGMVSSSPLVGIVLAGATMVMVVILKVIVGRRQ